MQRFDLSWLPKTGSLWTNLFQNSFTVSGVVVTGGNFWAEDKIGGFPQGGQLYINGDDAFNFLNLDGNTGHDSHYVWGNDGLAAANITPISTIPTTPEPSSLLLFGTSLLGLVPFRRKLFGR